MIRLGSNSKTRALILASQGLEFIQQGGNFDEEQITTTNPTQFVDIATTGKFDELYSKYGCEDMPLLVADTVVTSDNQLLRKAKDHDDARRMLELQSNNEVTIITCMIFKSKDTYIKDISRKSKKKIILIHCLPNFFCLFTYLAHGFRQYNTENINKISTVLGKGNPFVVKLGNLKLNYDHLKKTTLPLIFKKKDLMQNQSKSNYKKINNEILEMKKSFIPFSSFMVLISVINFSETEKKDLISNFFSIS